MNFHSVNQPAEKINVQIRIKFGFWMIQVFLLYFGSSNKKRVNCIIFPCTLSKICDYSTNPVFNKILKIFIIILC